METCPFCGKEVDRGGLSLELAGITLQHLCPDCRELGATNPKKLVADHRDVFEKMLTERRGSLFGAPAATETDLTAQQSRRERSLRKRYTDGYFVGRSISAFGSTLKVVGIVLAILVVLGAIASSTQVPGNMEIGIIEVGVLLGGIIGVIFYAFGVIVTAVSQLLRAILDCAVNTSPLMSNEIRASVMSLD